MADASPLDAGTPAVDAAPAVDPAVDPAPAPVVADTSSPGTITNVLPPDPKDPSIQVVALVVNDSGVAVSAGIKTW